MVLAVRDLDCGFGQLFCGNRGPTLNSLSPKPGEHDVAGSHGSLGFAEAYHSRRNTSITYPVLRPPLHFLTFSATSSRSLNKYQVYFLVKLCPRTPCSPIRTEALQHQRRRRRHKWLMQHSLCGLTNLGASKQVLQWPTIVTIVFDFIWFNQLTIISGPERKFQKRTTEEIIGRIPRYKAFRNISTRPEFLG